MEMGASAATLPPRIDRTQPAPRRRTDRAAGAGRHPSMRTGVSPRRRSASTGCRTLAANAPMACSTFSPGCTYCVLPRVAALSRSSRYVFTSYPTPNVKTRAWPCSRQRSLRRCARDSAHRRKAARPSGTTTMVRRLRIMPLPGTFRRVRPRCWCRLRPAGCRPSVRARSSSVSVAAVQSSTVAAHIVAECDQPETVTRVQAGDELAQRGARLLHFLAGHGSGNIDDGSDIARHSSLAHFARARGSA